MEHPSFDVLILGGGFAGVAVGQALRREARRDPDFKVALVSSENHMVFQPMLPEVAGAAISPRHVVNPIRQLCRGIEVFKGEVAAIDPTERRIDLDVGDFTANVSFHARSIVLALGAKIDLSRVPGMTEHALLMQNVGDAMKLRATIIGRFEEANLIADRDRRRQLLRFVVVGGGYSGVETAGEILDLMIGMHRWYRNVDREDFEVVLVHSRETLLPTISRRLGEYAAERLQQRGLRLILQQRVCAVTARYVTLESGEVIEASTVVSTVGTAPHPILARLAEDLELEAPRGRIRVRDTLQVPGHDWLWAAGDGAVVPKAGGGDCPPTAQFATRQGKLLGRNLLAARAGQPLAPFRFTGLGELAAIGHRTAVAEIKGFRFSGFIAWWMWRSIYLSKLPGFQRKLRVMIDWSFDLFFPRDLNLLNPRFSKPLREVHLEPGDVLFNPGEPAFSLYFVQTGSIEIRDGEQLIKRVGAGEYFGERALLDDRIWRFRATATKPSRLIGLPARDFDAIISGSSALRTLFRRSAQAYLPVDEVSAVKALLGPEKLEEAVRSRVNREVDTLPPEATLSEALALFRSRRHGSYPLVDHEGRVQGVLQRDALFDRLKAGQWSRDERVSDLPLSQLPCQREEVSVARIIEVMMRSGRNKVLVVDEADRLVGLVTLLDLLDEDPAPKG